jgi:hypothetical protein
VYKLQGTCNSQVGFEVTVTDDGVEIDTLHGLGVEEFVIAMNKLLVLLNDEYKF